MSREGGENVPPASRHGTRAALRAGQLASLRRLLVALEENPFYAPRLRAADLTGELRSLEQFTSSLPTIEKSELVEDQRRHPPYGSNLTYPLERYFRYHQTSGTSGEPLRWLDTRESWQWMLETWQQVFRVAGITPEDRIFFPFSFGPFLGFWTAWDAARQLGCLAIPGGGMGSKARLEVLIANGATAFCSTPTYAIRLAEVAEKEGVDLERARVRRIFVAGEPGGSVAAVRRRLAELWPRAEIFDHHGMTEVGPVSFQNPHVPEVLHVMESSYLAEILEPGSERPAAVGDVGELVLTTLGRLGSPLLRYRTGDLVRRSPRSAEELGFPELGLEGGVLARCDDMVVVRGVNLYPSALDQVIRSLPEVAEYRVELSSSGALTEVEVQVEPAAACSDPRALARRLEDDFRNAFQMRIPVRPVPFGSLPRFELKAKRWLRARAGEGRPEPGRPGPERV